MPKEFDMAKWSFSEVKKDTVLSIQKLDWGAGTSIGYMIKRELNI